MEAVCDRKLSEKPALVRGRGHTRTAVEVLGLLLVGLEVEDVLVDEGGHHGVGLVVFEVTIKNSFFG